MEGALILKYIIIFKNANLSSIYDHRNTKLWMYDQSLHNDGAKFDIMNVCSPYMCVFVFNQIFIKTNTLL